MNLERTPEELLTIELCELNIQVLEITGVPICDLFREMCIRDSL